MNLILIILGIIFVVITLVQMKFGITGHGYVVHKNKNPFWFWVTIAMWWMICICILIVGIAFT